MSPDARASADARVQEIENQLSAMEQASKLHPHDWLVLRRLLATLTAENQRLQDDLTRLKSAILPDQDVRKWGMNEIVALAEAHRQDSETVDQCEEGEPAKVIRELRAALQLRNVWVRTPAVAEPAAERGEGTQA